MPMKKVCPRCGATFDCMHNDILSCHCATVRLEAHPINQGENSLIL
ncbi:cysteine-rich CWC family protein, partial [Phocaeicola vulgatus]